MYGLRGQPDVPHNRDAAVNKAPDLLSDDLAPFQLHRLRSALLDEPRRIV